MQRHDEVDAVLVGTGWAASIVAQQLTEAGQQVVALERGRAQWTYPDFAHNHDYLKYAHRKAMLQDISKETWTWRPNRDSPSLPFREFGSKTVGQDLGGTGAHWAAGSWRFLPTDFTYRTHHIERYGIDKLPEGCTVQDWPLTYDELEPFYDRFEYDIGVSGVAGNLNGVIVPGGSPFEGWRSRPFPLPPLEIQRHGQMFVDACRELGYHPYSSPSAILSRGYTDASGHPRAGCLYCGHCSLFGCEVDAKGSPLTTHLPMALDTGRLEVRTHSTVTGIEVNDRGLATGLIYRDRQGREHVQPAARVFLTGFTLSNVRLLLLSGIGEPYDPQTGRGVVGRNYAYQTMSYPQVFYDESVHINPFMRSGANGTVIADFAGDRLDYWVSGFGTGGTLKGVARVLADERPEVKVVLAEPADAAMVASGKAQKRAADGSPLERHEAWKSHPVQGWSPDFIPKLTGDAVDSGWVHRTISVTGAEAMHWSQELARREGIFVGISAGATFGAAVQLSNDVPRGSTILCMLPDTGERYLTTPLFAEIPVEMTEDELAILRSTPSYSGVEAGAGTASL